MGEDEKAQQIRRLIQHLDEAPGLAVFETRRGAAAIGRCCLPEFQPENTQAG